MQSRLDTAHVSNRLTSQWQYVTTSRDAHSSDPDLVSTILPFVLSRSPYHPHV